MLKAFNVGQGDSFLVSELADKHCCFNDSPLLVDCGPATKKVYLRLPKRPLRVLVSHGDGDHIGGLADVLTHCQVSYLYVPRFLPELMRIQAYLAGKMKLRTNPLLPISIPRSAIAVAEGDRLCAHAEVLNPPKNPDELFSALDPDFGSCSTPNFVRALNSLDELGLDCKRDADELFVSAANPGSARSPKGNIFTRGFFVYLASVARQNGVDASSRRDLRNAVIGAMNLTSNQASIVFRFDGSKSWLFTGDADKKVFARLIASGQNVQANYLKVPHHGADGCLTAQIVSAIDAKYSIFSHNNRRFGKAAERHPTMNVLNLLAGTTRYFTNDVIRPGVFHPKTVGVASCKRVEFIG